MDNFKDTAYRVYQDVEILHKNSRWFNCCYLAGYIAECYCKLILNNAITSGFPVSQKEVRKYSHKIEAMHLDLEKIYATSHILSKYCLDLRVSCSSILNEWDPKLRYEDNQAAWNQQDAADKYKQEVECLIEQIKIMQLDGVI